VRVRVTATATNMSLRLDSLEMSTENVRIALPGNGENDKYAAHGL